MSLRGNFLEMYVKFDDFGGGSTPPPGHLYILLVVAGIEDDDELREKVKRFESLGRITGNFVVFSTVEIDKNIALSNALSRTNEGRSLYAELVENTPILCVSSKSPTDPYGSDSVDRVPFSAFNADPIRYIEEWQHLVEQSKQSQATGQFHNALSQLNDLIILRPGFFGVSVDLNKAISRYLERAKS